MKKRVAAIVICLVMVLSVFPLSAFAAGTKWSLSAKSIYIPKSKSEAVLTIYGMKGWPKNVYSSNAKIVDTYFYTNDQTGNTDILLYAMSPGQAVITVVAKDGTKQYCTVACHMAPLTLNKKSVTFGKNNSSDFQYVRMKKQSSKRKLVAVKSSKKSVATAKLVYGSVYIVAKKQGTAVVTVKDNYGFKKKIKVNVTSAWAKNNLKISSVCTVRSKDKKVDVYSKPGAVVTLKIGGMTYKKKIPKKGYAKIVLKKGFDAGRSYQVSFRYGGVKYSKTDKVIPNRQLPLS